MIPTGKTEKELKKMLKDFKDARKITPAIYKKLYSSESATTRFYGLLEIHKNNILVRPVVSFVGSATYALSRPMADILSPLVGKSELTRENSKEFAKFLTTVKLKRDEKLVSFDVASLFTPVLIELAMTLTEKRLKQDSVLYNRTSLSIQNILTLLSFCLQTTGFIFNVVSCRQVFGIAVGSPVSAVMANTVMEEVEQRALSTSATTVGF